MATEISPLAETLEAQDTTPSIPAEGQSKHIATSSRTGKKIVKKVVKKVKNKRPARPQVDPDTFKTEPPPQTGTIFNIWYNKWSGGDRDVPVQHAAPNRCSIQRDSGFTRADRIPGSYFCLFFARGICPKGRDCEYLHRLPAIHDIFNPNVDCFGRDKFADYRDDMGGVGSFMRQNRTLYVGRIHVTDDIEEIVARHFAEWGQIERIRVLNLRGVAFVTYSNLANSEFAKEAMAHQSLDHEEILNVRWATVDPNPQAQKREARKIEEQAAEAIRRALPPEYVAELEGRDSEATKRRKIEGSFGLEGYEAPDDIWLEREKSAWAAKQNADKGAGVSNHGSSSLGLPAPPEPLENAPDVPSSHKASGILSTSTLKALQNHRGVISAVPQKGTNPARTKPLVAYGSEGEEDGSDHSV